MTDDEALALIKKLAAVNAFMVTDHAWVRARQRGNPQRRDMKHALSHAPSTRWDVENQSWKTTGPDCEGDDLTLGVIVERTLLTIKTVF